MYSTLSPISARSFHMPKNAKSPTGRDLPLRRSAYEGTCTSTMVPSLTVTSSRGLKTPSSYFAVIVIWFPTTCANCLWPVLRPWLHRSTSPAEERGATSDRQKPSAGQRYLFVLRCRALLNCAYNVTSSRFSSSRSAVALRRAFVRDFGST